MPIDPTAIFAADDDDNDDADDDVDVAATSGHSRASPSLRSMLETLLETQSSQHTIMETFTTTKVTHGQLLDSLIFDLAALRPDFSEYRSSFPPPPPSDD